VNRFIFYGDVLSTPPTFVQNLEGYRLPAVREFYSQLMMMMMMSMG
jgi:hypothetical protein